jgi:hypothetical protein
VQVCNFGDILQDEEYFDRHRRTPSYFVLPPSMQLSRQEQARNGAFGLIVGTLH